MDNASVMLLNNSATHVGGAILIHTSNITIEEYSTLTFNGNYVENNGGALASRNCAIRIRRNATLTFHDNKAGNGRAMYNS